MDTERATEELSVIRQLMERPIRCSTMSGQAGILAGCVALAGLAVYGWVWHVYGVGSLSRLNMLILAGVFVVAASGVLGLTRLHEIRHGMPSWSPVKRKILRTILPPFLAGGGLTGAIIVRYWLDVGYPGEPTLIAPLWMLFYGLACWQVGEMSIRELRILGVAFLLAGLITAAFYQWLVPGVPAWWTGFHTDLLTLGVSFGGFHIVYGIVVWKKYGG